MKTCVFTTVFEEEELFPHWISYYSKHFDDVFVSVHRGNDSSFVNLKGSWKFSLIVDGIDEFGRNVGDWEKTNIYVRNVQKELLKRYYWVLYAHADEFIVPNPDKYSSIRDYIYLLDKPFTYCTGYEPIHVDGEPSIDWSKPLLEQRKFMYKENEYNKPLLSRVPLDWMNGFHRINDLDDLEKLADPDLYLFHLQKIDVDMFNRRSTFRPPFSRSLSGLIEIPEKVKHMF